MPKGPKGQKRPAYVIGNAITVVKIAKGEVEESGPQEDDKNKAAVELGRKGRQARARRMSGTKRSGITRKTTATRRPYTSSGIIFAASTRTWAGCPRRWLPGSATPCMTWSGS